MPPAPAPQTQPTPSNPPAGATQQPGQAAPAGAEAEKEGHERIAYVVPAFAVTNNQNAPPLTPQQKFTLFARSAFDPFIWTVAGIEAGVSQAENEFPEYGQGAAGYGKRYGSSFADAVDSSFMGNFLWPVILKEDPRYFRTGKGSFKYRLFFGLAQQLWCKTDKGQWGVCWENILAALSTGAISNAYYPPPERGFALTMSRAGISTAEGAAGNVAIEFWPDVHRWINSKRHKHHPVPNTGNAGNP